MTQAKHSMGTVLKREGLAVAELSSIGGVKLKADTIDVTTHDSPTGQKEFILGLKDPGEVPIEGNFYPGDSNGQMKILEDYNLGTLSDYTIDFPAAMGAQWAFSAVVSGFETMDAKPGDKVGFRATLKISGASSLNLTVSDAPTGLAVSVGTPNPAFLATVYDYVDPVVTGTTGLTFTVTAAGQTITLHSDFDDSTDTLTSGAPSSTKTLGAAGSITTFTVTTQQANKIARVYAVRVSRALA